MLQLWPCNEKYSFIGISLCESRCLCCLKCFTAFTYLVTLEIHLQLKYLQCHNNEKGQDVAMKALFSIIKLNMSLCDASCWFLGSYTATNDNPEKDFSEHQD